MKIWKLGQKPKQAQTANLTIQTKSKPVEAQITQETFKEHYPLLLLYSYAAEDEKKARAVQ